jgi:hypothetical protein
VTITLAIAAFAAAAACGHADVPETTACASTLVRYHAQSAPRSLTAV